MDTIQPNLLQPDIIEKPSKKSPRLNKTIIVTPVRERTNTLRSTQEFNEKFFCDTRKSIDITNLSIMKDDIKNYRELTDIQLEQLQELTETDKIELIKTYNVMLASIKDLI